MINLISKSNQIRFISLSIFSLVSVFAYFYILATNLDENIIAIRNEFYQNIEPKAMSSVGVAQFNRTQNLLRLSDVIGNVQFFQVKNNLWNMVSSHGPTTQSKYKFFAFDTGFTLDFNIIKTVKINETLKMVVVSRATTLKLVFIIFNLLLWLSWIFFQKKIESIKTLEQANYENDLINLFNQLLGAHLNNDLIQKYPLLKKNWKSLLIKVNNLKIDSIRDQADAQFAVKARQVAHDIKSPLSALTVLSRHLPEISEEKLDLLLNATNRINSIASDLLDKANQHTKKIYSVKYIESYVFDSVKVKQLEYPNVKIGFESVVTEEAPEICIDLISLSRALSNLINNAVEGSVSEKKEVNVKFEQINTEVILEVQDNGNGIPEKLIEKLKNAEFFSTKEQGYGLGYQQIHKFLSNHSGRLNLNSTPALGTKVTLHFPLLSCGD